MLEALATPFERTLGPTLGRLLADRYRSHGVDVRARTGVTGFGGDALGGVRSARLTDRSEIHCDVALVGIGVEPATRARPRAASAGVPIHACGDVTGGLGHWTSAAGGGVGGRPPHPRPGSRSPPQPAFFWSDQFGLRLQLVGRADATAVVEIEGGGEDFLARFVDSKGNLLAALGANRPADVAHLRRQLALAA